MASVFTLDISTLGGLGFGFNEQRIEDRGRGIILTWQQSDINSGIELFGYSVRFYPTETDATEVNT